DWLGTGHVARRQGGEVVQIRDVDATEMTSAEKDEARKNPAAEIEQLRAGDTIASSTGPGELEQVQVPVTAPVDDVVPAVLADLLLQTRAGDAVRENVGPNAALRVGV